MLPRLLCDRLCSLNPGEDRLTYSVIWTMNDQGEVRQMHISLPSKLLWFQILDEEFTRSVIRSCVKLSYEHAQVMFLRCFAFRRAIVNVLGHDRTPDEGVSIE